MQNKTKAFTLVELIVTIAILAILGTIAFISLQSYSKNSRDSVRISDLSSIKTSLELFHIDAGKYPLTSSGYDVTYVGGIVWNQGIFSEPTYKNVAKLDKIPKDPLTDKEYTYSVLNTRNEFELAGIMEGDSLVLNVPHTIFSPWEKGGYILPQANAADQTVSVMVTGNYNGEMLNVTKLGITCVVAVPSIIASSGTTLEIIAQNNLFVYNNFKNLPSDYSQYTKFKLLGESNLKLVNESNMDLYCGDYSQLNTNESLRLDFIENLQNSYSGTQVEVTGRIKEVLELTIDINNPSPDVKIYTIDLIENVFNTTISEDQKLLAGQCNPTYHDEGGLCLSDTREVTITNGIGTQIWNGTSWNSVVLQSCNTTFHTEDNITCISDIKEVTITNGTGNQTWNGSSWGAITATSCINGYTISGSTCNKNLWNSGSYGSCSVSCGGGTQSRTVVCKNYLGNTIADVNCIDSKPATSQSCNTQACPTSGAYTYGAWGSCNVSCGGGTQYRTQYCNYDSCYSPQATSQSCNTQACPVPINGLCSAAPGLCAAGTKINDNNSTACNTTRTRQCQGSNGGTTANCALGNPSCIYQWARAGDMYNNTSCSTLIQLGQSTRGSYYSTLSACQADAGSLNTTCNAVVSQAKFRVVSGCSLRGSAKSPGSNYP